MIYSTRLRTPSYIRRAGLHLAAVGFPVDAYEESMAADIVDEILRLGFKLEMGCADVVAVVRRFLHARHVLMDTRVRE